MLECMSKSDPRTWCGARKSDLDLFSRLGAPLGVYLHVTAGLASSA